MLWQQVPGKCGRCSVQVLQLLIIAPARSAYMLIVWSPALTLSHTYAAYIVQVCIWAAWPAEWEGCHVLTPSHSWQWKQSGFEVPACAPHIGQGMQLLQEFRASTLHFKGSFIENVSNFWTSSCFHENIIRLLEWDTSVRVRINPWHVLAFIIWICVTSFPCA
jgi:hypothetical protein